jgi:two-component system nitrogen regulation sensor histidine kinase NtrY
LLALFIFAACWFLRDTSTLILGITFLLLILIQIGVLICFIEKSQRDILNFLGFIQYDDFSVTYPHKQHSGMMKQLYEEYNKVIHKFRALRNEKESNFHFFRSILQHIDIGILAFNKAGEVKIVNTSALRLLQLSRLENINKIEKLYPEAYNFFLQSTSHQKVVMKWIRVPEPISISISVIEITINNEEIKLLSIQNIQSELEEKEMEAWQNMIRMLTHEIMNSLTPITSLAATVSDEMGEWQNPKNAGQTLKLSETQDLYKAIATIKNRSEGLQHFVEDFRNLSQIPKPKLGLFSIKTFFDELLLLMKSLFEKQSIEVKLEIKPETINLNADHILIEQVMINILKNAIESFVGIENDKLIEIKAFYNSESKIEMWVQDNGNGIEEEVLEKVFIPFYSTKKTGSGIGLTISKQIMRLHKSTIKISSEKGKGTLVKLIF